MATRTETDWHEVAGLEQTQLTGWITEHGRATDEDQRREWMREFIGASLEQDEDGRIKLMHGMLASMLTMDDSEAKSYASDFQWVLDHGKGDVAFASIQALHTAARSLPVEDTMRLSGVWPRVFGKDMGAVV